MGRHHFTEANVSAYGDCFPDARHSRHVFLGTWGRHWYSVVPQIDSGVVSDRMRPVALKAIPV